ncbi:MAG: efflux RND transporter periplasmic adaptor subunit [Thiotrichales bacterium]|nr:efflux RND transporter periplasmic adaptor subunit [Thiotrichales bacterium]
MNLRLIFIMLTVAFSVVACSSDSEETTKEIIRPVKYIEVSAPNSTGVREFPGTLQAKDRVDLSFQVSGKLTKLPIKEGQHLKKGELIGALDPRDFQAKYDSAVAGFKNANANYLRGKRLISKEYISQSDLDKLQAQKDQADANVRLAKKALEDTKLLAPFSGTVAKQYVRNFTDIQAKQSIISLQNNDDLEIVVSVPEQIIAQKENSNELKIDAVISTIPDKKFPLKVNEFATEADPVTRTYKITLGIIDKEGFNLFPGMTATVELSGPTLTGATLLPVDAVFADPEGSHQQYVWVIDKDNKVHKAPVEIGELKGSSIEVLKGITEKEKIVVAGVHYLTEGQQVKLLPPQQQ